MKKLKDLLIYKQPTEYIVQSEQYDDSYTIPVLTAGKSFVLGKTDEQKGVFDASQNPIILFDDFTTATQWVDFRFKVKSSACKILEPKNEVNLRYVYYAVQHITFDASQHMRYWISKYSNCEINYPSNDKQSHIVTVLDSIQRMISVCQEDIFKFNEMIKSRFNELFGDSKSLVKIGDVLSTTSGGTPSKGKSEYYLNGDIPWLCSGEVNVGIITEVKNRITKLGLKNSSAKWIPKNSVVVAMYGATAGKVGLLKIKATTNQAVCSILPSPRFIPEFLYYAVGSKTEELVSKAWGGAQPNISQGIIKNTFIPNPTIDEQKDFASFVTQVDKLKFNAQKRIDLYQELLNKKMDEYFN